MRRGKDGHLTLGFNNDDFFKDPLAAGARGSGSGGPNAYGYGSGGMMGQQMSQQPKAPEVEAVAQKRFANAKAISSK